MQKMHHPIPYHTLVAHFSSITKTDKNNNESLDNILSQKIEAIDSNLFHKYSKPQSHKVYSSFTEDDKNNFDETLKAINFYLNNGFIKGFLRSENPLLFYLEYLYILCKQKEFELIQSSSNFLKIQSNKTLNAKLENLCLASQLLKTDLLDLFNGFYLTSEFLKVQNNLQQITKSLTTITNEFLYPQIQEILRHPERENTHIKKLHSVFCELKFYISAKNDDVKDFNKELQAFSSKYKNDYINKRPFLGKEAGELLDFHLIPLLGITVMAICLCLIIKLVTAPAWLSVVGAFAMFAGVLLTAAFLAKSLDYGFFQRKFGEAEKQYDKSQQEIHAKRTDLIENVECFTGLVRQCSFNTKSHI